jgi:hypothetical protein
MSPRLLPWLAVGLIVVPLAGCASPYHTDQGALFGGLLGAGTGAVVGHAVGNTGAGAVVGAGVGALSGATIGAGMDESEARNRQLIEERAAQQAAGAGITVPEVVNMTRANVDEGLIINQIHARGLTAPLQSADVIYLQQQGVSRGVIAAMQTQPVAVAPMAQPVPVYAAPGPVVVEERWGAPGYYYYGRPRYYAPPPRVGVGFSFR